MRRLLPFVAVILISSAAQPALASVIPIDPIIGVRGRDSGSELSDSNAFFEMEMCPLDLRDFFGADRVFCFDYEIVQSVELLNSLTFQFSDANGLISNSSDVIFLDESSFNGFPLIDRLDDGFSVKLLFDGGSQSLQCPAFEGTVDCAQGSTIQVYLAIPEFEEVSEGYSVSLRAVNDIQVTEPGLLILMGTGLVLAGRRFRRRQA